MLLYFDEQARIQSGGTEDLDPPPLRFVNIFGKLDPPPPPPPWRKFLDLRLMSYVIADLIKTLKEE